MQLHPEALFLLQAVVLIGLPLALWRLRIIRTFVPLVAVQVSLGLVLGPTIFGGLAPDAYRNLFPESSLVNFNSIAWIGVSLLGFLTGLHFDFRPMVRQGLGFLTTSVGSLIVPLIFGALLALAFYTGPYVSGQTSIGLHTIGIAIAVAVTALPVLSAILIELKLIDTPLGKRVLGYAAVNDITLWLGLGLLMVLVSGSGSDRSLLLSLLGALAFLIFMLTAVRNLLGYLARKGFLTSTPGATQLGLIICAVLLSAFATELLGLHFIFGAFIFGAIIPKTIHLNLFHAFEKFTMIVLMPFYFMLTGLKTSFSLHDTDMWILFVVATIVAITSKIIGTAIPERLVGKVSLTTALSSGVLMQTKGLMEIVVLNVLLAEGIINTVVFSALVLMAVTSTLLTKPLMLLVGRLAARKPVSASGAAA